jgi:hypothetical protein
MITILDNPAVASAQWPDLVDELDRWRAGGRIATLWWRDDDAIAPSRQLDNLLAVARGVPVALAVIPALVESGLADWVERYAPSSVRILQHGWRHVDHGTAGRKSEFPSSRSQEAAMADLAAGRIRLTALFGTRALAVLAPPWNRFAEAFLPLLTESDITAISKIAPRRSAYPAPGVFEANVHVDLVAWRGDRGFVGETTVLGQLVGHLRARRCGNADAGEPTGILTHHLIQDEATGAFLGQLVKVLGHHPAAQWLDVEKVFAPGVGGMAHQERV